MMKKFFLYCLLLGSSFSHVLWSNAKSRVWSGRRRVCCCFWVCCGSPKFWFLVVWLDHSCGCCNCAAQQEILLCQKKSRLIWSVCFCSSMPLQVGFASKWLATRAAVEPVLHWTFWVGTQHALQLHHLKTCVWAFFNVGRDALAVGAEPSLLHTHVTKVPFQDPTHVLHQFVATCCQLKLKQSCSLTV